MSIYVHRTKRAWLAIIGLLVSAGSALGQKVEVINGNVQKSTYENKSYLVVKSLTLKPGFAAEGSNGSFFAKIHTRATAADAPSPDQNFVQQDAVKIAGVTTQEMMQTLALNERTTTYRYLDALARFSQSVAVGAAPGGQDMIQPSFYDGAGKPSKEYLPYTSAGLAGSFRNNWMTDVTGFYNAPPASIPSTGRPFKESVFEESAQNNVLQSTLFGAEWAAKYEGYKTSLNDAGVVRYWEMVSNLPRNNTFWAANTLEINETRTVEDKITRSYTDFQGRTVLKEVQTSASTWARTYYMYDDLGNLLYVIPPQVSSIATPTAAQVDTWYYQYQYDDRQRLIGKKMPGAGWEYVIYDKWDRAVLTQNALQRAKSPGEWTFTKYDDLNRPVATGIYKSTDSPAILRGAVSASSGRYETRNTSASGYSLTQTFPTAATESDLLSLMYYDNYGFVSNTGWDQEGNAYGFVQEAGFPTTPFMAVKGLPTGAKSRVINSTPAQWLNAVTYYDNNYRPLQVIAEHHLGKTDRVTTEYDFTAHPVKSLTYHTPAAGPGIAILKRSEYDAAGRISKSWHKVGNLAEVLLSAYEYNELGQLVKKNLHQQGDAFLQVLDYRYTINGWLRDINFSTPGTDDPKDYFELQLAYQDADGTGNTPRYDGLVTAMQWKDGDELRSYKYGYDLMGQLRSAAYAENGESGWNVATGLLDENIAYNDNGNISSMARNGDNAGVSAVIDNLTYTYTGNQVTQVVDAAPTVSKDQGYKDANTASTDFIYNVNGGITQDRNKGITQVTYNHLNLPERFTFGDGSYVQSQYEASGRKLKETVYDAASQISHTRDYINEFVYDDNVLIDISTGAGVYRPAANSYLYALTDHLGNTRVVVQSNPVTTEEEATLESASISKEQGQFLRYEHARRVQSPLFDETNGAANGNAVRLNGTENERYGLAKSLSVMPGDVVTMSVAAKYLDPSTGAPDKGVLATVGTIAGGALSGGTVVDGAAYATSTASFPFAGLLPKDDDDANKAPKAYMNYVVFDHAFKVMDAGYVRISEEAREDGRDGQHETLQREVEIKTAGYLYVYLSNENETASEVYFDDFKILRKEGPVVQINGYYPYGAPAYSWVREDQQEVNRKFQEKEYNSKLGTYDFGSRRYDGFLGRWMAIDPAGQFASPYTAMGNNPVMSVDPTGELAWFAPIIVGAYMGAAGGIVSDHFSGNGSGDGMWKGALMGAVSGVAGIFAPAGFLPGLAYGSVTGAATGAGSAALNGADIGQGAKMGAIKSGVLGGLSGGLDAYQADANIWTGKSSHYTAFEGAQEPYFDAEGGAPREYSQKSLDTFRKEQFGTHPGLAKVTIKPDANFTFDKYGQLLDKKTGNLAWGYTRPITWGGGRYTKMVISKYAFHTERMLFMTVGHEYVHAYHYYYGLFNNFEGGLGSKGWDVLTEYGAYHWSVEAARQNNWPNIFQSYLDAHDLGVGAMPQWNQYRSNFLNYNVDYIKR